jgi:two-component system, NtrC family, sensor kinase
VHVPAASAAYLPWLWPDAQALAAIAKPLAPAAWAAIRRDPAALLLVLRQPSAAQFPSSFDAIEQERFLDPRILETALQWFQHDRGCWLDWRHTATLPLYETALAIAYHAQFLAEQTHSCDPAAAWTAGLLAPLGWFAMAAHDPALVSLCRSDPAFHNDPTAVQRRLWGLDHASIARRLARRWQLPDWLRVVIGHGDLSIRRAEQLGADPALFAVAQLACLLAEEAGYSLALVAPENQQGLLDWLRPNTADLEAVRERFLTVDFNEAFEPEWLDPRTDADCPERLRQAIDRRRAETAPYVAVLERDLDRLHQVLAHAYAGDDDRLRDAKLEALAEFAAGASHEINNPLAVIAGQSQYLLHRITDERQRQALESIMRQTQRIHGILVELMQFARPPQINPQRLSLTEAVRNAAEQYRPQAEAAGVEIQVDLTDEPAWVDGDLRQVQTAIGCLVRNAVEAATPGKGWVRLRVEATGGRTEVCVEDNGPGLTAEQRRHMFDPFYCGRPAGRGRGLGLPTAWRLAREHGGDVRHVTAIGGPTQFILTLPLADCSERLSA